MQKVLILDSNQRSALAATRSLGKKGIAVVVADETVETLAGSSKYCQESFVYPSPYERVEKFITTIKKESFKRGVKVIFPMTEVSAYLLLKNSDLFTGISIPFSPFEAFDQLSNKWKLFELAHQLGISVPETYFIKNGKNPFDLYSKLKFPVVLKPYRSRILSDGKWISASVKYASSVSELEEAVSQHEYFKRHPFLIQEYIHGQAQGIFVLYDHGIPVAFFAHRRLREKPPSGGVSVLSESIEPDPYMCEMAQRILDTVKWHGVAMVEFKVSSDGTPYLMEVNARFWGSLQLAIDAGMDFPYLLYKLAVGEKLEKVNSYKISIKSRWLLGDLDNLYLTFKGHNSEHSTLFSKSRAIVQFLKFFEKNTRYEVNRWDDMRPFLFELKHYLRN